MSDKLLDAEDLTSPNKHVPHFMRLPDEGWLPVLQHACDFPPDVFETIGLNLIKNPSINSSELFRADILYDSQSDELADAPLPQQVRGDALSFYNIGHGVFPELRGFDVERTILRRMIPRNPQLDKATLQTCLFLTCKKERAGFEQHIVIYIPHSATCEELPWYHPRVQALAYLHSWNASSSEKGREGTISLHYRLYSTDSSPLNERLLRTGQHLLTTLYKHGQEKFTGYEKQVHVDQLVLQKRVQDTYSELKRKHASRLRDGWVEQTEPSKHIFEDLGLAAYLIELWKDMYPSVELREADGKPNIVDQASNFPGFVDIGCGNGVLVDVLIQEGYKGWGFDARRRKTWSTFVPHIQGQLKEMILIPQPLFELRPKCSERPRSANGSLISNLPSSLDQNGSKHVFTRSDLPTWHNGIFASGTFIISNHADELTAWTPLLASLSASPFLAIPCCSHNLSGARFRAPSVFNNQSADRLAPTYFAANVSRSKHVAIVTVSPESNYGVEEADDTGRQGHQTTVNGGARPAGPETGDLKKQSQKARAKQPSAYSSLCDWVAHLSTRVGYSVEKEILRLPSTRNIGIVGRRWMTGFEDDPIEVRMKRVMEIAQMEKADGAAWVGRIQGLGGNSAAH